VSAFIEESRARFGVEPICRALDVSASAYYKRATGWRSERQVDDERLLERIRELHAANYFAYGSRRMWKALLREGEQVGRSRVERLMRRHSIQGAKRRGKPWRTTKSDPTAVRHPDLVNRDFTAPAPDRLWLADFTYLRCHEGVVFFSFVIDAFSRMIVGWQFASNMRTDLVLDALRMALTTRQRGADVTLIHHSDAGSQGEFKWSSQRSIARGLRWEFRSGVGLIVQGERQCVRPVGQWLGVRIVSGSGRRLRVVCRARLRRWRRACRLRLVSGGFVRVAACRRSPRLRCPGATCLLLSGRRSRCCAPAGVVCVRPPACWVARRRRSRGSFVAMPRLVAAGSSIGPRPRSGTLTGAAGVRRPPSLSSTPS
jgi:hypothetical protein